MKLMLRRLFPPFHDDDVVVGVVVDDDDDTPEECRADSKLKWGYHLRTIITTLISVGLT